MKEFVGKKRKNSEVSISAPAAKRLIPPPSNTELSQFFDSLASCSDAKPAVLAVVSPYCDAYVPLSRAPELPMVLSDLCRTDYFNLVIMNCWKLRGTLKSTSQQTRVVLPRLVLGIRPILDYCLE